MQALAAALFKNDLIAIFVWVQKKVCLRSNAQNFCAAPRCDAVLEVCFPAVQAKHMLSDQGFPGSHLLCISAVSSSYWGEA